MDELTGFIRKRLDEDEAAAKDAGGKAPHWSAVRDLAQRRLGYGVVDEHGANVAEAYESGAEHIARHDPARVLREVAAKRFVLEAVAVAAPHERGIMTTVLRYLALPYDGHPDYREEWRPS